MKHLTAQKALTPKDIANGWGKDQYRIPIYQRLFAWDHDTVSCLVKDLNKSYSEFLDKKLDLEKDRFPYYIGLITSTINDELVDGQQRFTALILLGVVLKRFDKEWNAFLQHNDICRLSFVARDTDNEYLNKLISNDHIVDDIINDTKSDGNQLMNEAIRTIYSVLNNPKLFPDDEYKIGFSKFVFRNTSFFISILPYSEPKDLNKYFEAMNSTGRNLENHEILKVNLLNEIKSDEVTKHCFTLIWNAVADMDTLLVRKRGNNESASEYNARFLNAINATLNPSSLSVKELFNYQRGFSTINNFNQEAIGNTQSSEDAIEILRIKESEEEPEKTRYGSNAYRSLLTFSDFILHVLYLDIQKDIDNDRMNAFEEDIVKKDFFDANNLQTTFKNFRKEMSAEYFISTLLMYRLLYDYFVIRISSQEDKYQLYMKSDYEEVPVDEDEKENKKRVIQFESFQYVFSNKKTYYKWLCPLLSFVSTNPSRITFTDLLTNLKTIDNNEHPLTINNPIAKEHPYFNQKDRNKFRYDNGVDRYWFWRIDYYLWENRNKIFLDDNLEVCKYFDKRNIWECVDKYTFRRNRSIEHIAVQHPVKEENEPAEPYKNLHELGNLVMISSGLNSSLKNTGYQVKRGHIEEYISKKYSIESLSMLQIYLHEKDWDDEDIIERTDYLINFLMKTYNVPQEQ